MRPAVVVVCLLLLMPSLASAQKWEVEVHGGWRSAPEVSGGSGSLPPAAPSLVVTSPLLSVEIRRVPSWMFGDGAQLLNTIVRQGLFPGFGGPQRITPLDTVANGLLAQRGSGASFGVRVSRAITPRLSAEVNVDYTRAAWEDRNGVAAALRGTTSSFKAVFESDVFPPSGLFPGKTVTTADSLTLGDASEITVTGAVRFNLLTRGRVLPYVTGGLGVARQRGDELEATASGTYRLPSLLNGIPFEERDAVRLRQTFDDSILIGVIGGGVTVPMTGRSGVRVDVRAHVGSATDRTLLSATPHIATTPATGGLLFLGPPTFSLSSSAIVPSNLSAPAIADFTSFEVSGTRAPVFVTVGYFFRF